MKRQDDSGFTLMEALVALIIITVMATMLYRGLSSGLRLSGVADHAEEALLVAKARLAGLGIETPLQSGRQEGQDGNVQWEMTLRPYGAMDEADRATQLRAFWATVTVTWGDGRAARPHSLQLTTIKLGRAE